MTTPASTTPLAEPAIARSLNVELLALDLNTCTRCTGSRASIDAALALVKPVLDAAGIKSRVHLRVIETEEQARQYRFVASPTIRVNGLDIAPALHESHCDSCGAVRLRRRNELPRVALPWGNARQGADRADRRGAHAGCIRRAHNGALIRRPG
ncbi:MAG: DUF2703 domain-containing protein [Gemmatimonadetes bacterium]|nr:DUF2703 domain-containing protein [Gemmatimonadota bacterium]